jgi:predicted metal-dependent peptidase
MVFEASDWDEPPDWAELFGEGISRAVARTVRGIAEGYIGDDARDESKTVAGKARDWFITKYPLLGSLAAGFKLIENQMVCARYEISIAAVSPELREIYLSPGAPLSFDEYVFVLAHELLHVGLGHHARCQGRDPYLWNVACDYVINGWLIEMEVGAPPKYGLLLDPELKDLSAESVYDHIVTHRRRYRKLMTLRGRDLSDILPGSKPGWWKSGAGLAVDEFCRRSLRHGLDFHTSGGRGYLPAALIEEIQALGQPPIPWDVKLAEWFDERFPPLEKRRTFARASRRQSATPDIPRPGRIADRESQVGRTFGVVLDTSGSMDRELLAKALGAIASYSMARDVELVRVIFCDAACYDQGYMSPEDIAGKVKVKGRGGTVIQPAIDLLEKDKDFPKKGPLLIITDGWCDDLRIHRDHAFLLPEWGSLPFAPTGEVFRIS